MLELVRRLNDLDLKHLVRLDIAGRHVGYLRMPLARALVAHASTHFYWNDYDICLRPQNAPAHLITAILDRIERSLSGLRLLPKAAGELVDVRPLLTDPPVCRIDRNLLLPFGVKSRRAALLARFENGDYLVATRSSKAFTDRGCFDVPAGGLLPAGERPWDWVLAEAEAAASIPPDVVVAAGPAVALTHRRNVAGAAVNGRYQPAFPFECDGGTNWDEVLYWTVLLPDGFVAQPRDGEVKSFSRMAPDALVDCLRHEPDRWKTNAGAMFLHCLARGPAAERFDAEELAALDALEIPDPRTARRAPWLGAGAEEIVTAA